MENTFVYRLENAVYINLTNSCCNDCSFCLRRNADTIVDNNSLWLTYEPTANEVIAALKNLDFEYNEAVFCGYGESTYRLNEMLAVAKYLKSIGKKVRLNTNGLGNQINSKQIEPMLKGLIDTVSVSLNAATAEKYDELCRSIYGPAAFDFILAFAKNCSALGIKTILTVVDIISKDEIKQCSRLAEETNSILKVRKLISDNISYN